MADLISCLVSAAGWLVLVFGVCSERHRTRGRR